MPRKVKSRTEAMLLHERYNAYRLRAGRVVAVRLALQHGEVHAGMVGTELVRVGALPWVAPDEATERWHGGLFADRKTWEPTGRKAPRHDVLRNTHNGSEPRNIWRLVAGADITKYAVMPPLSDCPELPRVFVTNTDDVLHAERNMLLDFVALVRAYEQASVNELNEAVAWDAVDDALRRMGHPKPTQNVWPEGEDE